MATQTEDNGFLYFIVGGLVVVVALVGFIYLNDAEMNMEGPAIIERTERTIERTNDATGSDLRVETETSQTPSTAQ